MLRDIVAAVAERILLVLVTIALCVLLLYLAILSPPSFYSALKRTGGNFPEGKKYDPFNLRGGATHA